MKRNKAIALFILLVSAAYGADQSSIWNNSNGNWSDAAKWSTSPLVPNNGNGGFTFDVVQNAGTITVDLIVSIQKYTLNGGNNTGSGFALTINELFLWSPGADSTLGGTGAVNAYGGITFSGAGNKILNARTLNNGDGVAAAAATWSAGNLFLDNSAIFNNSTNATFTATGNNSISASTAPVGTFNNAGTFNKTGGTGTTDLAVTFNNTGIVNVDTGTLNMGGGISTGLFEVDSGATLRMNGSHTFSVGSSITGVGNLTFASGTSTLNSVVYSLTGDLAASGGTGNIVAGTNTATSITVSGGTLNINTGSFAAPTLSLSNAGVLGGTGSVNISGTTSWSSNGSSRMAGTGITNLLGTTSFIGANKTIDVRTVNIGNGVVAATASWTAGDIFLDNSGVLNNTVAAVLTTNFDGQMSSNAGGGTFNNSGTFSKTGGSGSTNMGVTFNNTGTVNVDTGTFNMGGGTSTGLFDVDSGATLRIASNHTFSVGASVTGAGNLTFAAGTSTLGSGVYSLTGALTTSAGTGNIVAGTNTATSITVSGGTLNINTGSFAAPTLSLSNAGVLGGTGSVNISGTTSWSSNGSSRMAGTGITNLLGTTTFIGANKTIDVRTVNIGNGVVAATASWTAGDIFLDNSGVLNNTVAAVLTTNFDGSMQINSGTGTFNNAGTFSKTAGSGSTSIGVTFNNTGTVNVDTGTFNMGGGTSTGLFDVDSGATLRIASNHTFSAGASITGAGNLLIAGGSTAINSGVYSLTGAMAATGGTANFNGGAITATSLAISGAGILNVNTGSLTTGTFSLSGNGTLGGTGTVNLNGAVSFNTTGNATMTGAGITNLLGGATFNASGLNIITTNRVVNNGNGILAVSTNWTAGEIRINDGASINNTVSAIFSTNFDGTMQNSSGTGTFNNSGTFNKSGGSGSTSLSLTLNNTGTVNVSSGTLTIGALTQHVGATLNGGTYNVTNGASINRNSGTNITTIGSDASITLDGANSNFAKVTGSLNNNQGSFTLKNGRALTTSGAYANSGTTRVEGPTTLMTIGTGGIGIYTQTTGDTFLIGGGAIDGSHFYLEGGSLRGNGTITSHVTGGSGSHSIDPGISMGSPVGLLAVTGSFTNTTGTTWLIDIVEETGSFSDIVAVSGALHLGGATLNPTFSGDSYVEGRVYQIATYGSYSGTFNGLGEDAIISGYRINYGTVIGNTITLTAVPEPGTLGLLGIICVALLGHSLRRHRSRSLPGVMQEG